MGFFEWLAAQAGFVPREEMESNMAAIDEEMRERLRVASDKAATKLREVQASSDEKDRRIAELEGSAASDAESDSEALRPIVEMLEGLGNDENDPVPAVDPVPSDPTPVPGTEPGEPADGGPVAEQPADGDPVAEQPAAGGTVEQPGVETDAPVDPATGETQGGPAV